MPERHQEKSAQNFNLDARLKKWQASPNSPEDIEKMQALLEPSDAGVLQVRLKLEVLKEHDREKAYLTQTVAEAYGRREGFSVVFDLAGGVGAHAGRHKEKGYLYLKNHGQRIGYVKPEYIEIIKVN